MSWMNENVTITFLIFSFFFPWRQDRIASLTPAEIESEYRIEGSLHWQPRATNSKRSSHISLEQLRRQPVHGSPTTNNSVHPLTTSIQTLPSADKWFVCFRDVRSIENEDFLETSCILSCFVQLKRVLWTFCVCVFFISAVGFFKILFYPNPPWTQSDVILNSASAFGVSSEEYGLFCPGRIFATDWVSSIQYLTTFAKFTECFAGQHDRNGFQLGKKGGGGGGKSVS